MNNNFCNNLKYLRKEKNISYQYLADKIGVSRPTISYWEKGNADPTMGNLVKLAEVLNVDIISLINGKLDKDKLNNEIVKVPIISDIKNPDNIIDYTYIASKTNDDYFALNININSSKYQNNDLVIFKKINNYKLINNSDCFIEINNNIYFTNVTINENGIVLIPVGNNPIPKFYSNKQLKDNNFKILGVAIEKRTKL